MLFVLANRGQLWKFQNSNDEQMNVTLVFRPPAHSALVLWGRFNSLLTGLRGQIGHRFRDKPLVPCNHDQLGPIPERFFMPERWLSVDEIAAHLGVNPDNGHINWEGNGP